jgi:hypothetical protein
MRVHDLMIETTRETYVPDYTELYSRKKKEYQPIGAFKKKWILVGSIQLIILEKEIDGNICVQFEP